MSLIRRAIFLGLALVPLVLLAACGDDDADPESLTITSDDGKLTLEIPPEAVDEDVEITVTAVPLEDLPDDLQVVQGAGDGYLLEPSGLEFSEPVAVSLELDRAELADEPDGGIAAYALVSLTEDGERELLDELVTEATLGEETVVARGELSHFSWITRTKGSLVVSLEEKPRKQAVGATFTAKGNIRNGDSTGAITLDKPNGTFMAFGALSTSGDTTFDKDFLDEGESVEGTGTFKCDKPGLGTYTLRAKSTSLDRDSERRETPLTVTVDGVVECVEPTATPTPTPAPTPSPTSGTASDPDEIYLDDPTDDATECDTGENVVDPAVDIRGVALIKDGDGIAVEVLTVQSPETTFLDDFSAAILVTLGDLEASAEIHDGQLHEAGHVTWTNGGVSFLFPDASSVSKGDPLFVDTFHLKTAESTRNCDTLAGVYSCFGRCDD